jgi:hypothetical protein
MVRTLALLVLLAGCGSGGGAGNPQYVADCNSFIANSYCPKIVECLSVTQQYCLAAVQGSALNCANVVGENGDLVTCETDLANDPCSQFDVGGTIVPPPSCAGIFQLR